MLPPMSWLEDCASESETTASISASVDSVSVLWAGPGGGACARRRGGAPGCGGAGGGRRAPPPRGPAPAAAARAPPLRRRQAPPPTRATRQPSQNRKSTHLPTVYV